MDLSDQIGYDPAAAMDGLEPGLAISKQKIMALSAHILSNLFKFLDSVVERQKINHKKTTSIDEFAMIDAKE